MKWTMRQPCRAHSCSAVIPRNRSSCGKKLPVNPSSRVDRPARTGPQAKAERRSRPSPGLARSVVLMLDILLVTKEVRALHGKPHVVAGDNRVYRASGRSDGNAVEQEVSLFLLRAGCSRL